MKKYNVILVIVDGARVDRIHKSKEFRALAGKGTFFSQMITAAPYTVASMHSIFSGMYGSKNGVDAYNNMFKFKDSCKTLTEYLKDEGYHTRGDTIRLSLVPGRGFDKFTQHDENNDDVFEVHDKILDEMKEIREENKPFFLYLHYGNIHTSIVNAVFSRYTDFDDEYFDNIEKNSQDYDTYLEAAGDYIGRIMDGLNERGLMDDSIVVFMADHGMGVGEKKGERAYGIFTYDYSIRSFAIMLRPDIFPEGKEVPELTQSIDIMPTILDSLGIPPDNSCSRMQGESLIPLVRGEKHPVKKSLFSMGSNMGRFAYCETGGLYRTIFIGCRNDSLIGAADCQAKHVRDCRRDTRDFHVGHTDLVNLRRSLDANSVDPHRIVSVAGRAA